MALTTEWRASNFVAQEQTIRTSAITTRTKYHRFLEFHFRNIIMLKIKRNLFKSN